MISASTLFLAFAGGILPAVLWLVFWLREDKIHPEPRNLIITAFISGMAAVIVALFIEDRVAIFFGAGTLISVTLWAATEEIAKYIAAYLSALRRKENDEPVDNMIYLISTALGFAALENAFFLLGPIGDGSVASSFITGNLRFIGSTLLHVIASGTVGIAMAYAFCQLPWLKKIFTMGGLVLATLLHTMFNFFILKGTDNLFAVFSFVWIGIILLLLFFERVKRINRSCVY